MLCTKLRDQADVPAEVAQDFAEELFHRVRRAGVRTGPGTESTVGNFARTQEEQHRREVVNSACLRHSLALLRLPVPGKGQVTIPANVQTDSLALIDSHMQALDRCAEELKLQLRSQDDVAKGLDDELFERSGVLRTELVDYLKEYMLTLQVAEERQQQMMRAINDAYNVREFMEQQRSQVTKVALLRQWKNLESLRVDLGNRLATLCGLEGQSLGWLAPTEEDAEVKELKKQVQQKDRVVQILKQRLKTSAGNALTEEEEDLLACCEADHPTGAAPAVHG